MAHYAHILRRSAGPNVAGIFVKNDIQHPMDAVFDAPMAAHEGIHLSRRTNMIEQVGALVGSRAPIGGALRFHERDTSEVSPAVAGVELGDAIRITDDIRSAGFEPPVPTGRLGRTDDAIFRLLGCPRIGEERLHIGI
jgi:hypothetical protein